MSKPSFRRFLLSGDALQIHILFGGLAGVLIYGLWADEAPPDAGWALLFTVVVYPVLIALVWWQKKADEKFIEEHIAESLTEPEKLRRKRRSWRMSALVLIAAAAIGLYYAGKNHGLLIESLPAEYFGYFLMGLAVLGLCGVNIWYGGPLDPRLDPPPTEEPTED